MRRIRKAQDEVVGQDSFLDIVANLVGILIILIMVVGARAKDAMLDAETDSNETAAASTMMLKQVDDAKTAEHQVQEDIYRMNQQLKQQEIEVSYRQAERDRTQLLLAAAEESVARHRDQLNESQRNEFDTRNAIAAAQSELDGIREGVAFLEGTKPKTEVIEHLPTPMAKTVFGKELHLRLKEGRLAFIPWDDFIQLLKEDAPKKAWRLKDQNEFTELIGPIGGFWMNYTLKREVQTIATKLGVAMQQTVNLERFTLQPESDLLGEPLEIALKPNSQLQSLLDEHRPESSTVTVWTYPDSFEDFRRLKQELFNRGYVTAARPLPADHPIGGSPEGTRSAAQ